MNLTYIRRSEDVLDVFLMSYVRSTYILSQEGSRFFLFSFYLQKPAQSSDKITKYNYFKIWISKTIWKKYES